MSTTAAPPPTDRRLDLHAVDVEIVLPVHDEERVLARSVQRLHGYLSACVPWSWMITIADNASTDGTWSVASDLAYRLDGVRAVHLGRKGRGGALRQVWGASRARVAAYMDVDLSTDLKAFLPLVAPLLSGHSDVAIGTRLAPGARVERGAKREIISRCYNLVLRTTLRSRFSDAQCGFKAVRTDVGRRLLPLVEDGGWFFDTELLALAERNGLRIHEVPVDWVDDPDTRVAITRTAGADLRGVARLVVAFARGRGALPPDATVAPAPRPRRVVGQVVHFAGIGLVSTATFAVLYCLLFGPLGAVWADVVALGLCATANLAANRRLTFHAAPGNRGHSTAAMALAVLPLALAVPVLLVLRRSGATSMWVDLLVALGLNLTSSLARFDVLREAAGGG